MAACLPNIKYLFRFCMLAAALVLVTSCGRRLPERVVHVCIDGGEINESILQEIRSLAEKHGFTFSEHGQSAKANLMEIDAGDPAIPRGLPIFFDIKKGRRGILIGSNFGSQGEALRISIFDVDSKASIFSSDLIKVLDSLPNSRILTVAPNFEGRSPCSNYELR